MTNLPVNQHCLSVMVTEQSRDREGAKRTPHRIETSAFLEEAQPCGALCLQTEPRPSGSEMDDLTHRNVRSRPKPQHAMHLCQ